MVLSDNRAEAAQERGAMDVKMVNKKTHALIQNSIRLITDCLRKGKRKYYYYLKYRLVMVVLWDISSTMYKSELH